MVNNPPAKAGATGDTCRISGSGRSPGGGNGNPLQYSFQDNPKDGGAWWATVHGVAKSETQLNKEPGSPTLQADALLSEPNFKGQTV